MSDVIEIAASFVHALASGDVDAAHKFLSQTSGANITATELSSHFEALADDMGGVTGAGQPAVILEEWPDMTAQDRAMVYVPLEGDEFSEAITVTVSQVEGSLCISAIEWGRP
ncbi:MAG: hypothetical protein WBN07_02600 [Woeseiaceae bacterium]